MYNNPQWKLIFLDGKSAIFLKNSAENKKTIERFAIDLNKYQTPHFDLRKIGENSVYPAPYLKRAEFFNMLKKDNLAAREAKEALRILPSCGKAYYLLGSAYLRQGRYLDAWENFRLAKFFSYNTKDMRLDFKKAREGMQKEGNKNRR